MKQLKRQRPSRRQIAALLTLYDCYSSKFFVRAPLCSARRAERDEQRHASLLHRECDANQLTLPLPPLIEHDSARAQRLAWASGVLGHEVASFSELHSHEAALLIDTLKRVLGQKINPPRNRPDNRDQARACDTAGRRDSSDEIIQLVDDATLDVIAHLVAQIGWNVERFNAFLLSSKSPVRNGAVRTMAEGNRVIWALRNMLRHSEQKRREE